MAKSVKDAYSEILRLRNEFYQKWQDAPQYDENRSAYKAKYEAFDKALELLTPSIVDPQPEDSRELDHSVTKISDQEEPVNENLEEEWKRYITSEEYLKDIPGGLPVARHFANWQKQQMMKAAVEGQITLNEMGDPCVMLPSGFNAGDEVKLIVLKEE